MSGCLVLSVSHANNFHSSMRGTRTARGVALTLKALLIAAVAVHHACAFVLLPTNRRHMIRSRGGTKPPPLPPPPRTPRGLTNDDGANQDPGKSQQNLVASSGWMPSPNDSVTATQVRGGGGAAKKRKKKKPADNVVQGTQVTLQTAVSFWQAQFRVLGTILSKPVRLLSSLPRRKTSKYTTQQEQLMEQLRTTPVRGVLVPNTTVLPHEVIQIAAQRAGMIGQPLRSDRVQAFAQSIHKWYQHHGYVLHSVTAANLRPENSMAEIEVVEPIVSQQPVGLTVCKEMVVDPENPQHLISFREYKDRMLTRKAVGADKITKDQLNTTYVPVAGGRTKPSVLAAALRLYPGSPFQWSDERWQKIARSRIFGRILRAAPQPLPDGTVQLNLVCTEAPYRHLEYGLGQSLYTGSWEGEIDFEHANVLGGGETLAVSVRRGTQDSIPSGRVRFTNDKFGLEGGYDIEIFSDYLGGTLDGKEGRGTSRSTSSLLQAPSHLLRNMFGRKTSASPPAADAAAEAPSAGPDLVNAMPDVGEVAPPVESDPGPTAETESDAVVVSDTSDVLQIRRGFTVRVRNPINPNRIRNTAASASLERTLTASGSPENVGSTTLDVGPIINHLPLDAKSGIDARCTVGTRWSLSHDHGSTIDNLSSDLHLLPFTTVTATTKQILPIRLSSSYPSARRSATTASARSPRPVVLALRHSVTASTSNLPRHEARALGIATSIRGATPNGPVTQAIRGTTELRIPLRIPTFQHLRQQFSSTPSYSSPRGGSGENVTDNTTGETESTPTPTISLPTTSRPASDDAGIVIFGDWLIASSAELTAGTTKDVQQPELSSLASPFVTKSSVGIGFRKRISGIPIKYDVSYSPRERKIRTNVGLGMDFDL
jgi:hypothetical protein